MDFKLHSEYKPTGDQPQAIADLVRGFKEGNQMQTLLGVTGSGKTFTMANVIEQLNKAENHLILRLGLFAHRDRHHRGVILGDAPVIFAVAVVVHSLEGHLGRDGAR